MNDLIKNISEQFKEHCPNVEIRIETEDEMKIYCNDESGFDILIQQGDRENTIYFGAWHFHFNNEVI